MSKVFMPFYGGDFIGNTMHLSRGEIGSYVLLLWHHWEHGSLPADEVQLQRIARCQQVQWPKVWDKLKAFFMPMPDNPVRIIQYRCLTELSRTAEISNKRKAAALQMHSKRHANAMQMHTHSHSHSEEKKESSLRSLKKEAARGTRLPEGWRPCQEDLDWAFQKQLGLLVEPETEKFCDYWKAKAGANATKLDWSATWRNWMRKASEQQSTNGGHRGRDRKTLTERGREILAEIERAERSGGDEGRDFPLRLISEHRKSG